MSTSRITLQLSSDMQTSLVILARFRHDRWIAAAKRKVNTLISFNTSFYVERVLISFPEKCCTSPEDATFCFPEVFPSHSLIFIWNANANMVHRMPLVVAGHGAMVSWKYVVVMGHMVGAVQGFVHLFPSQTLG